MSYCGVWFSWYVSIFENAACASFSFSIRFRTLAPRFREAWLTKTNNATHQAIAAPSLPCPKTIACEQALLQGRATLRDAAKDTRIMKPRWPLDQAAFLVLPSGGTF